MHLSIFMFILILIPKLAFGTQPYTQSILDILQNNSVESMIPMEKFLKHKGYEVDFYGDVYHVTLKGGTEAVFKALLPDDYGDIHAEVAAFKASQFLGFPNVPPTILRTINGETGSLQLYVKPSEDSLKPGVYKAALKQVSPKELADLKLFYFVFGQFDSGPHNIIIQKKQKQTHLIAIDNSGIRNRQYVRYGELPFIRFCYSERFNTQDFSDPFPFEKVKHIKNRNEKSLHKEFGNTLFPPDFKRLTKNSAPLYYVIYQNSLWIQFNKNNSDFVLSYTDYYPKESIAALKKLNISVLQQIFSDAKKAGFNSEFLTKNYMYSILERRDQILKASKKVPQHVRKHAA